MNTKQIQRAIANGIRLELGKMSQASIAKDKSRLSVNCRDCSQEQIEKFREIKASGLCANCESDLKEDPNPSRCKRLQCSKCSGKFYAIRSSVKDTFAFERPIVDAFKIAPGDFIDNESNEFRQYKPAEECQ